MVDELTAEDPASVYIPDIPFDLQQKIGTPVREAYELRDKANVLENQAVSRMEAIISPE